MSYAAQPTPQFSTTGAVRPALRHTPTVSIEGVPWYLWTGALAVAPCFLGGSWDVSWHRSIGRDSFWTPAHRVICLCGVVAGIIGLWLMSQATLNRDPALGALSVSIFGMRAPLGVFIAGWGGMAMLTSVPFGHWWHNACGLDVKIFSSPHTLLILGVRAVGFGMLFLILAAMDRSKTTEADHVVTLRRLFVRWRSLGGWADVSLQEFTSDVRLHTALAYISMAIAVPVLLATFSQAFAFQWAATTTAAVHTSLISGDILISPAFPTQPKFGPVFYPVTRSLLANFPMLMVAPGIVLGLLWRNTRSWNLWQVALASRPLFTVVSFAGEWPFGTFLLSRGSGHSFLAASTMATPHDRRAWIACAVSSGRMKVRRWRGGPRERRFTR